MRFELYPTQNRDISEDRQVSSDLRRFYLVYALSQFLLESTIWLFFLTEYHQFSLAQAVAYNAGTTLVLGLLDLPTGSWADRFGRRRMVIIGFISRAIGALLMLFASSAPMLVLAAISTGFGFAQMSGALGAFVHDNLKARGVENRFQQFMINATSLNYTSRTIAFIAAGCLYTIHPTLPIIILFIVLSLGAYITFLIRELPYERTVATTDHQQIVQGIKVFWEDKRLLKMMLVFLLVAGLSEQLWFSFQPLLSGAGVRPLDAGLGYALGALGSVVGSRLVKRFFLAGREHYGLSMAAILYAIGAGLFALLGAPTVLILAQFISCVGFGIRASLEGPILNPRLPSSHRAVCLSIVSTIEACLSGLMGIPLGYLYENIHRSIPPICLAIAFLALVPKLFKTTAAAIRN